MFDNQVMGLKKTDWYAKFLALVFSLLLIGACSPDTSSSRDGEVAQDVKNETLDTSETLEIREADTPSIIQPEVITSSPKPADSKTEKTSDLKAKPEESVSQAQTQKNEATLDEEAKLSENTKLGENTGPIEAVDSESVASPIAAPVIAAPVIADRKKPDQWLVNSGTSKLTFAGTQTGTKFEGQFEKFEATIRFDPENLDQSSIEILVDMSSAKTGDRQRDTSLPAKEWFHIKEHPTGIYISNQITAVGAGAYEAKGTLKIRDIEKEIVLPFSLDIEGDKAVAKGRVTIIRTGFEVGQGQWATDEWVGLNVDVGYEIDATRKPN